MNQPISQQQWEEHQAEDRKHFEERPTIEQLEAILDKKLDEAFLKYFTAKGLLGKNILVTTATIITSLVLIGTGIKWILAVFGFSIMTK